MNQEKKSEEETPDMSGKLKRSGPAQSASEGTGCSMAHCTLSTSIRVQKDNILPLVSLSSLESLRMLSKITSAQPTQLENWGAGMRSRV